MEKATKIPKIPKNLSDKDMFAGYVEENTVEAQFMAAEAEAEKKKRAQSVKAKEKALSGLPEDLLFKLEREVMKLQMELFNAGNKKYTLNVKREGNNIIISPKIN